MIDTHDGFLVVTSHDFKANFTKYLDMLRRGAYPGIIVRRYDRAVGVFYASNPKKLPKK